MKRFIFALFAISLLSMNLLIAQNPFKKLGVDVGVITLSQGKYIEFIPYDSIQHIGSVVINIKTGHIIELINTDSVELGYNYRPDVASRWISPDPLAEEYWDWTPYNYCTNNPLRFIDPNGMKGEDIIFLIDKKAASGYGHGAVLIGNEQDGWTYISMNGTGEGASPKGDSKNPDIKTAIVDADGNKITDPIKAMEMANSINPNEEHSYDSFKRIETTKEEDANAIKEASEVASDGTYSIAGPGSSCIDVMQAAFGSVVKDRNLDASWYENWKENIPGESDLIPNNWFNKLEKRIEEANNNGNKDSKKIKIKK